MATISSPGLGSGLDVKSIVSQLVALERKPIETLNTQKETLKSKLSAFGLMQSYMTNVQDAASVLAKASTWQTTKASSADATIASATSTTTAVPGNYSLEVTQLAQAQSLASGTYTSSLAQTGTGTLHIELGTWDAGRTTFTPKSGTTSIDVVVAPGQDSLEAVRSAINAANAGVSASIVREGDVVRLALRSQGTGLDNSLRITADADAPGTPGGPTLSSLVYNPPGGAALTETLAARNATGTINGLAFNSTSNTLASVVEGVTITLAKPTTTALQLTVAYDTAAMRKTVDDFVSAYNEISKYIREQTKYDEDKKVGATLQGDRSTLALQSQLRSTLGAGTGASLRYGRLSDMGVQIQADGSLKVNDAKFNAAVTPANLAEFSRAMTQDTGVANQAGFAVRLKALATQLTGVSGPISTRSDGLRTSITRNETKTKTEEERIARVEERLTHQYSALDTRVAQLNALNTYVTQQITNWNKSN